MFSQRSTTNVTEKKEIYTNTCLLWSTTIPESSLNKEEECTHYSPALSSMISWKQVQVVKYNFPIFNPTRFSVVIIVWYLVECHCNIIIDIPKMYMCNVPDGIKSQNLSHFVQLWISLPMELHVAGDAMNNNIVPINLGRGVMYARYRQRSKYGSMCWHHALP